MPPAIGSWELTLLNVYPVQDEGGDGSSLHLIYIFLSLHLFLFKVLRVMYGVRLPII